ncbi:MAG: hypothetical protein ACYS9X_03990 [Planctomycetota bacterium]
MISPKMQQVPDDTHLGFPGKPGGTGYGGIPAGGGRARSNARWTSGSILG